MPDTVLSDLFEGLDPADVASAMHARAAEIRAIGTAKAHRRQHQVRTRRVTNEEALAGLLPATVDPGDSWHILSAGDIDVLSITRHLLAGVGYFDHLLMTTWRINRDDLEQIEQWLDAGTVERFDLVIDQRFARLAPDEHQLARRLADTYGGSCTLCLNHSKVTLCASAGAHLVIESSANVNTNHRLEQTAVHHSAALHAFYLEAFHAIRSRRDAAPA